VNIEEIRGISLKCDPELAIELREQHSEVTPAYHFNKIIIPFYKLYNRVKCILFEWITKNTKQD